MGWWIMDHAVLESSWICGFWLKDNQRNSRRRCYSEGNSRRSRHIWSDGETQIAVSCRMLSVKALPVWNPELSGKYENSMSICKTPRNIKQHIHVMVEIWSVPFDLSQALHRHAALSLHFTRVEIQSCRVSQGQKDVAKCQQPAKDKTPKISCCGVAFEDCEVSISRELGWRKVFLMILEHEIKQFN